MEVRLDGERVGPNGTIASPDATGRIAYRIALQPREYDRLLQSKSLTIRGGLGHFAIDLTKIAEVGRLLSECNVDLLTHWGFSREQQALQATFPQPLKSPAAYVLSSDRPRAGKTGTVGQVSARVAVAADGTVSDCVVIGSSGDNALDQATCAAFVRRAKMNPARDKSGRPIPSIFVFARRWPLPW